MSEDNLNGTTQILYAEDQSAKKAQIPRHDDMPKKKEPSDLPDVPKEHPDQKPPMKVEKKTQEKHDLSSIENLSKQIKTLQGSVDWLVTTIGEQFNKIENHLFDLRSHKNEVIETIEHDLKKHKLSNNLVLKNWITDLMDKVTNTKDKEQDVRSPRKKRSKTRNTRAKPVRKKSKQKRSKRA